MSEANPAEKDTSLDPKQDGDTRRRSSIALLPEWVKGMPSDLASSKDCWPPYEASHEIRWSRSTHEIYHDPSNQEFNSPFGQARSRLDYTYHLVPVKSRQDLQDAILTRIVEAVERNQSNGNVSDTSEEVQEDPSDKDTTTKTRQPWIVFTAGPMGVGKGYVLSKLHSKHLFPLEEFIKIDPDMLKSELPEFTGYLNVDPESAATKVHRESTQMADVVLEHALAHGIPTLVDGSLRDVAYYTTFLQRIRSEFPTYKIAIVHVTASREVIFNRATTRAEKTGRVVPVDLLNASIEQVPRSVAALTPLAHAVFTISNQEGEPLSLVRNHVEGELSSDAGTTSMTWEEFAQVWGVEEPVTEEETKEPSPTERPVRRSSHYRHRSYSPPGVCQMNDSFDNQNDLQSAKDVWGKAYPSFCPRCTLLSDEQCGVCIHGKHRCACDFCAASGFTAECKATSLHGPIVSRGETV